jgi:Nuclease-related domain
VPDWLYPYLCGAGRRAHKKYDETSRAWRERIFRRPRLIGAALIVPIVGVIVWSDGDRWLTLLSAVFGLLLGIYLLLLQSPPAYIDAWWFGAIGERRTARALAPLRRRGCRLLHDLPDRRRPGHNDKGNIDHVVVSPFGVFVLDSKFLAGELSIVGDTVHVQRRDDPEDAYDLRWLASSVRGCAARLQEDIASETSISSVNAVVVFWGDFRAKLVERRGMVFIHGDELARWLCEQPRTLAPERVALVATCIAQARQPEHAVNTAHRAR